MYLITTFQVLPLLTIFNYPSPPPLSSFDLLFWLGGGAWMQKVREHASIARSEQKKIFDPWGGV